MPKNDDLKPCPFCGGKAMYFKIDDEYERNHGGEGICCINSSCDISTGLHYALMEEVKTKLMEIWNRRTNGNP